VEVVAGRHRSTASSVLSSGARRPFQYARCGLFVSLCIAFERNGQIKLAKGGSTQHTAGRTGDKVIEPMRRNLSSEARKWGNYVGAATSSPLGEVGT
jgi:hypothetical protein